MHITAQQEEFSRAYVHAVAAAAGYKCSPAATPDDDSVDLVIAARGLRGTTRSPRLDIQLKCVLGAVDTDPIAYSLKQKNYDDLRHVDYQAPRILVLVFVPEDLATWVDHSEQALALRYCAYWRSLYGLPDSGNGTATTVHVPRANLFHVAGLKDLMNKIGLGRPL